MAINGLVIEYDERDLDLPEGIDFSQFKIPPSKIKGDDCSLTMGRRFDANGVVDEPGRMYFPHEGEYVWILPTGNTQAFFDFAQFRQAANASETDVNIMIRMEERFRHLADALSKVVVAWTWTDIARAPLEQPYRRPDVLAALEPDELMWLLGAGRGETAAARKNGSAPLAAISTARARRRRK